MIDENLQRTGKTSTIAKDIKIICYCLISVNSFHHNDAKRVLILFNSHIKVNVAKNTNYYKYYRQLEAIPGQQGWFSHPHPFHQDHCSVAELYNFFQDGVYQ